MLFEFKLFSKHNSTFLAVAVMFLLAKITLYMDVELEGLCLQLLRMRVNIYFGLPWWDDAVRWKNISGIPHL